MNTRVAGDPESLSATKCLIEQTLCQPNEGQPQLAKDFAYALSILDAWRMEDTNTEWMMEWKAITYYDTILQHESYNTNPIDDSTTTATFGIEDESRQRHSQTTPLHGHFVRRKNDAHRPVDALVLLFHTGAGPHDIFLLWKAASLLANMDRDNSNSSNDRKTVVVFITDILSDETGWAWNPAEEYRTRYQQIRQQVFETYQIGNTESMEAPETVATSITTPVSTYTVTGGSGTEERYHRPILQRRIQAAIQAARSTNTLPVHNMAALGWCLGGHSILELARMQYPGFKAMITFHGVFDTPMAVRKTEITETVSASPLTEQMIVDPPSGSAVASKDCEVLVCNGSLDPFVTPEMLQHALTTFQYYGYHTTSLLQLALAKHGFTNPAQDYNENSDAFQYNEVAAHKAWKQTLAILLRKL